MCQTIQDSKCQSSEAHSSFKQVVMMVPTVPSKGVLTGSKSPGKRQPVVLLSKPPISQATQYILPISAWSMSSAQFRPSNFHEVLTTSVVTLSLLSPHLQAAPVFATTGKSLNCYSVFRVAQNKLLPSLYITVDKTHGVGDFNCVKGALDSLPLINLVRVVIKANPGVYTLKQVAQPLSSILQLCSATYTNVFEGDVLALYGLAQGKNPNSPLKTQLLHADLVDRDGQLTIIVNINNISLIISALVPMAEFQILHLGTRGHMIEAIQNM